MGILNLKDAGQALDQYQNPVPGALRYVCAAGTDILRPIFVDANLRDMAANPMRADDQGKFEICYLPERSYRVVIRDTDGTVLFEQDDVVIAPNADFGVRQGFDKVADVLEDGVLAYTKSIGRLAVTAGDIIRVSEGDYLYRVAPPEAADYHLMTTGGVKLLFLPGADGNCPFEAFGAVGDGVTDDSAAFQKAVDSVAAVLSEAWLSGTPNKVYGLASMVRVALDGCMIDMRGAKIKTLGDIAALEIGEPAGSSVNAWKGSGVVNCVFEGSGPALADNRAVVVRNHSYGNFSGNSYTNFGAKPILIQAHGRGVQYNNFSNSEIYGNHDGAIEMDSGVIANSYVNDNLVDNLRTYENPKLGGGGVTHVLMTGTGEMIGNRFQNSSFETNDPLDTILDIQCGSANSFTHIRLDGEPASLACRVAVGCNANWFWLQGQQGTFDDNSGSSVLFGDRGSSDFPFIQFGSIDEPTNASDNAFYLGMQQPGSTAEFHLKSTTGTSPFRFPGTSSAWFGDRDGGENAPVQVNGTKVMLRTLPSKAIGAGPKIQFEGKYTNSGDHGNISLSQDAHGLNVALGAVSHMVHSSGGLSVADGIAAPATIAGRAVLYVDGADGNLKVKFGDGVVKIITTGV